MLLIGWACAYLSALVNVDVLACEVWSRTSPDHDFD